MMPNVDRSVRCSWSFRNPSLEHLFVKERTLRLGEWFEQGRVQVIKRAFHRSVYRVVLPDLDFFVKYYPVPNLRAWLRQFVRPSKARTEYETALAIRERGISTIEPLAFGESHRCGPSYLVTRTLQDITPLSDYLEFDLPQLTGPRQIQVRQQLTCALGRFVAQMHEAGIVHLDPHPGNVLVRFVDDSPLLYLIDVHDVRLGAPLTWEASRDNLVTMNRWFSLRSERTDRTRFWRAYNETRPDIVPRADSAQRELEAATLQGNLRFWRQHDKNCLLSSRYFRRIRTATTIGHAVTDLDSAWLDRLLHDPEEPFRRTDAKMLKDGDTSTVIEIDMQTEDGPRSIIYKKFLVKSWRDPWTALFRHPPGLRCFVFGHGLRQRDLPTPRPLAVFYRRKHGLRYEGYLLQEKVPQAQDLHEYLDGLSELPANVARDKLHSMLDQLGRLLASFHRRALSHRDLKAGNLLVSPQKWTLARRDGKHQPTESVSPGEDHVWFVDLVGVSRPSTLLRRRRVQNLARLHASFARDPRISRSDKLRFLYAYLGWEFREKWKSWWKQIEAATQKKIRHNQRTGRPLT